MHPVLQISIQIEETKVRISATFLYFIFIPLIFNGQSVGEISFSSEETLEVVSWNLEYFPKNGQNTVDYVAAIINQLDADVIACQEISDQSAFNNLISKLNNYSGYYVQSAQGLAFLYNNHRIDVNQIYEIYTGSGYSGPFPRRPLVIDFNFQNKHFIVINNHLKCCGDGYLNSSDSWDEETRRLTAMDLLKSHIDLHFSGQNVFVVGDFNDELTDPVGNNVFRNVLDDKDNYLFADIGIATGNPSGWSYPGWPSHLDHILVTNELFSSLDEDASKIEALKLESVLGGGWDEYVENVSDHRPVALRLMLTENLGTNPLAASRFALQIHPNPVSTSFSITISDANSYGSIELRDLPGQVIASIPTYPGQAKYNFDASQFKAGCYIVTYKSLDNHLITSSHFVKI